MENNGSLKSPGNMLPFMGGGWSGWDGVSGPLSPSRWGGRVEFAVAQLKKTTTSRKRKPLKAQLTKLERKTFSETNCTVRAYFSFSFVNLKPRQDIKGIKKHESL